MNRDKIKEILDKSDDVDLSEEIKIIEYIDELNNRIDKAIEYIENHFLYHYGSEMKPVVFEDNYIQEIVDILRGEE